MQRIHLKLFRGFCHIGALDYGSLVERLQKGLDTGFAFYKQDIRNLTEAARFGRLMDLAELGALDEGEIRSSGYVIDTLESAVWSLINTDSFQECLLKAVNLGDDSDTIPAKHNLTYIS